jgi:hypothetical protein
MCGRLQYYCLVQIISRIGATWYQIQFGFRETVTQSSSSFQTAVFAVQFLLTPTAGIGYLIVFLAMQPEALSRLRDLLQRFHLNACCCQRCLEGSHSGWKESLPARRRQKRVSKLSEGSFSSAMEERILEDIRGSDVIGSVEDRVSAGTGDLQHHEIDFSEGVDSWSSSQFLGDDQELAEELQRLYQQGRCEVASKFMERIN